MLFELNVQKLFHFDAHWVTVSICVFKVKYDGRYHATTQNRFYPDMSNANKNITVEAKLISPPIYNKT